MATRTIVTSQPDVACDVCERRLLRGEQPDVFLVTGRRRIVCELCVPRAVHEGWLRESDDQSVSLPPLRPRRGRSLLDRLPVPLRLRQMGRDGPADSEERGLSRGYEREADPAADSHPEGHGQPYDFLDGGEGAERPAAAPGPAGADPGRAGDAGAFGGEGGAPAAEQGEPPSVLDRALELFNLSEYPRRVAGVARSLGPPEINVRSAEHAASVVRIVVAWELCWYRYEVDLDEPERGTSVISQGTELGELEREDRVSNGLADDSGRVSLSGV
jgi:hypothetical protein